MQYSIFLNLCDRPTVSVSVVWAPNTVYLVLYVYDIRDSIFV